MKKFLLLCFALFASHQMFSQACPYKGATALTAGTSYPYSVAIVMFPTPPTVTMSWSSTGPVVITPTANVWSVTVTPTTAGAFTVTATGTVDGVPYTCTKSGTATCPPGIFCNLNLDKPVKKAGKNFETLQLPVYRDAKLEQDC